MGRRTRNRDPQFSRLRIWLGAKALWLWWVLQDPHDSWAIEYRNDEGGRCGLTHEGRYSTARIRAREVGGRIVGWRVTVIPCGPGDPAAV